MKSPIVKKIYLHLGLPKTGTSSLQHYLLQNEKALKEQGILFAKTARGNFDHHHQIRFSLAGKLFHILKYCLNNKNRNLPIWTTAINLNDLRNQFQKEINEYHGKNIIISSEWLALFLNVKKIKSLKKIFYPHQVIPVIYIRKQEEFIQSLYAQLVKDTTFRIPFKFNLWWLKVLPFCNYYKIYQKWQKAFESKNIKIRRYNQLKNNDIIEDFFSIITSKEIPGHDKSQRKNPHLDTRKIKLLRIYNKKKYSLKAFEQTIKRLETHKINQNGFSFISKNQAKAIANQYHKSNKKLANLYFNRKKLF